MAVQGQVPGQEGTALRAVRVWRSVLGVQHTVIEKVELERQGEEEMLVATVRPTRSRQGRCGRCGVRAALSTWSCDVLAGMITRLLWR